MGAEKFNPYQRKKSDLKYLTDRQEFADEAFEIINNYARHYDVKHIFGGASVEIIVRHMLHCESVGYSFTPEQREYAIKTCLGIIPVDKVYEREIGYFGQSKERKLS